MESPLLTGGEREGKGRRKFALGKTVRSIQDLQGLPLISWRDAKAYN
jgi:hypothetical protein